MRQATRQTFRSLGDQEKMPFPRSVEVLSSLGMAQHDRSDLIEEIKSGFPVQVIDEMVGELKIQQRVLLEVISLASATLARRRHEERLSPSESDRVYRVARAYQAVIMLFEGDRDAARKWLDEPAKALGGNTPLHHLDTEAGAHEVEDLIGRLEHGIIG